MQVVSAFISHEISGLGLDIKEKEHIYIFGIKCHVTITRFGDDLLHQTFRVFLFWVKGKLVFLYCKSYIFLSFNCMYYLAPKTNCNA